MADDDVGAGGANFAASQILPAASRAKADAFIDKQNALADLQIEDLTRENAIRHWSLRVRHVSDVLKLGFELAIAFIVIALAVGLGMVIWQATQADGLVIDSIAVPAPMAQTGLTGEVIANKLLDQLTIMQNQTDSIRAASSFAHDWTNDIKVEIPDTGVSLGQVVRFLNGWLGHQIHLSGELYQTPEGIALTLRLDNDPGKTFEGKADDLNDIIARASETVYARAQPYRYSVYLGEQGRFAAAYKQLVSLAASGPQSEHVWTDIGLAVLCANRGDEEKVRAYVADGLKANPNLANLYAISAGADAIAGHDEDRLQDSRRGEALLKGAGAHELNPAAVPNFLQSAGAFQFAIRGDYRDALETIVSTAGGLDSENVVANSGFFAAGAHDIALMRHLSAELDQMRADPSPLNSAIPDSAQNLGYLSLGLADWRGAIAHFEDTAAAAHKIAVDSKGWIAPYFFTTQVLPYEAYAYARLGNFAKADAILNKLPQDCDVCMRYRGQVEALRHNWGAAAHWFALVSTRSPDIPFADTDWGAMLMAKGDLDGAIAKFESANQKGPHFADPLEMWGEALMRKNRSDLALAKFEEAAKYAPNWGRLHLKWGEALWWSSDKDGARKQFAIAATRDPTPSEEAERVHMEHIHG
jgi:tetratricopeptide (TPR) repeat protein